MDHHEETIRAELMTIHRQPNLQSFFFFFLMIGRQPNLQSISITPDNEAF